jgi:hypothetical protein
MATLNTTGRDTTQTRGELAKTQALLDAATHSAAYAQSQLNFQLREGETAAQQFGRRLEAAKLIAEARRGERIQNAEIGRELAAAGVAAADNPFAPSHGGGGGNTAHIREQIAALTQEAEKFGVSMDTFGRGRREGLPHYLARLQHDLAPAIEGARNYATALMDMAEAEHAAAQAVVAEEDRIRRAMYEAGKEREAQRAAEEGERRRTIRAGVDARDEAGRGLLRGLDTSARTAGATNAAEDLYRDGDANVARARNLLEIRQLTTQAMAAEQVGNRGLADSLMAEAAARTQVVQSHDEQIRAMQRTVEAGQTFSGSMGIVWGSVTGALQNHLAALVQGKEDAKTAFMGMAKDALQALSTRAIGEALAQLAIGFGALAIQNYPGAASAFTSAGLWAAVGAVSGVASAAIPSPEAAASKGSATAGANSPRAASAVPAGGNNGGPAQINYHINWNSFVADEASGEKLVDALRDHQKRTGPLGLS